MIGRPGPAFGPRLFGGQAVGQALMAAYAEEDLGRHAHSLHAHFLKPGMAADPIAYTVTDLSAGRSFATRRVEAHQDETLIFAATVSFHAPEPGFAHQQDTLHDLDVASAQYALAQWMDQTVNTDESPILDRLKRRPIEIVPLDPGSLFGERASEPRSASWMRLSEPAQAPPPMQRALLSYASDMMFLRNAMLPHAIGRGGNEVQAASLDHALWFHKTPDFSQWHLFVSESPWAGHARGLNRGHFYDERGRMVATVSQENLMRPRGAALERTEGTIDQ